MWSGWQLVGSAVCIVLALGGAPRILCVTLLTGAPKSWERPRRHGHTLHFHTAVITATAFTILNAILLTVRIRCENTALHSLGE